MTGAIGVAVALTSTGLGPTSYLEMVRLVLAVLGTYDAAWCALDARRVVQAVESEPDDRRDRASGWLARSALRTELQVCVLQGCFAAAAVIAATAPPVVPTTEEMALRQIAVTGLYFLVQASSTGAAWMRRRTIRRVTVMLRLQRDAITQAGGRRWYERA